MLRILLVARSTHLHNLGGMESVTWDLAREFSAAGNDVTILTSTLPKNDPVISLDGVRFLSVDANSTGYSKKWWSNSLSKFKETIENYDVILSISIAALSIAKYLKSTKKRIPVILQSHGTARSDFISKMNSKSALEYLKAARMLPSFVRDFDYKYFSGVIAVGPRVYEDFGRWPTSVFAKGLPFYEVPNGISPELFYFNKNARDEIRAIHGIGNEAKLILSASRLHQQKGVHLGIEAIGAALRADPNLVYLVAGDGPSRADLERQAGEMHLQKNVVFAGSVARSNLFKYYSAADAFLFTTTRVEGMPMSILEALASGLPCIVSAHLHLDDQQGLQLVNPRKIAEVSNALISVHVAADRTSKLASRYTLSTCAKHYIELMESNSSWKA